MGARTVGRRSSGAWRRRTPFSAEDGLTVVEYGLIVALIGLVFVLAGPALGDALAGFRDTVTGGVAS
jgi:Flp pilus assembly pilin Flp